MDTGLFSLRAVAAVCTAALAAAVAHAQTPAPEAARPAAAGASIPSSPKAHVPQASGTVGFKGLTPGQQKALAPLASHWGGMGDTQRLKWLEMVRNFHTLPPAEQDRLHGRMAEWANLSYEQRAQARLNFAEVSKLDASQKKVQWEAYQALSTEERSRLTEGQAASPAGAARAVRPSPPQRLATLPPAVTPRPRPTIGVSSSQFDQKTLLPQHLSVQPTARAPAVAPLPPSVPEAAESPASPTPPADPAVAP